MQGSHISIFCGLMLFSPLLSITSFGAEKQENPNVLIIIGDDCTYNDLPLYGGKNIQTPNIDRLAGEGMTFNRAFVSMSMCAPCRAELYTGLYPVSNGVCWNYVPARTGTKSIVHHLGKLGYRVGIAGKIHATPQAVFPFEEVEGLERDCVSETAEFDDTGMAEFIMRDKKQPFCLIVGLVVPHLPWTVGDPSHFIPEQLDLPANFADTEGFKKARHYTETKSMREDYARYLAEIEVMDDQVGRTLKMLEETGASPGTIVIFTSEQGSQFPGNKYTNWNTGIHTGFVVRWPGKTEAGVRTDALIQYADVLPTLMDIMGADPLDYGFSGTSFLSVLLGRTDRHREYAYSMHNNVPEGSPYPIRSITDGTYHYIRNLTPERLYIEKHIMSGQLPPSTYWSTWMWDAGNATEDQHSYQMVCRFMKRPAEELYRMDTDPYEFDNLAEDDMYQDVKKRLSSQLDHWLIQERDPGKSIDTFDEVEAAFSGNHFER
jgi:N-sulfoglucosamine sulfohydrolase